MTFGVRWRARARVVFGLGVRGVAQVGRAAIELARVKRSLGQRGLRESLADGEYEDLFAPSVAGSDPKSDANGIARDQSRIVRIAAKRVGATCLPRSIVLARRLRDSGLHPSVRIGVAELPTLGMAAHAWVELNGQPVGEDAASFAPFGVAEVGRAIRSLGAKE
jgi:Transglutaminase-like superfamily